MKIKEPSHFSICFFGVLSLKLPQELTFDSGFYRLSVLASFLLKNSQ